MLAREQSATQTATQIAQQAAACQAMEELLQHFIRLTDSWFVLQYQAANKQIPSPGPSKACLAHQHWLLLAALMCLRASIFYLLSEVPGLTDLLREGGGGR